MSSQRFALIAGAQIIQFIGTVLQSSTYITDQLKAVQNPTKADAPATPQSATTKTTDWFRISVSAVPIGTKKDKKRNDYPYKITYIVTTYAINQMQSQYFNDAKFRGIHKSYDYWFTGQNTQVLRYEQSYNNQYINVMGSRDKSQGVQGAADGKEWLARGMGDPVNVPSQTATSIQGSTNDANTPAATAADYLYSFADQGTVKIQVIGDPAWLLQGEIKGITPNSVNFNGFYPDGSVCYETGEVIFAINFNAPADYNNAPGSGGPAGGTGLMDTISRSSPINSASGSTQASAAYKATTIKSTFSKGSFTQELEGTALTNLNAKQIAAASNGRSVKGSAGGNGAVRSDPSGIASSPSAPELASAASPKSAADQVNDFEAGLPKEPAAAQDNNVSIAATQTSTPTGPTTSNGEDVTNRDPIVTTSTPGVGRPATADELRNLFLGPPQTNNQQTSAARDP
jgi:hypothetical protein